LILAAWYGKLQVVKKLIELHANLELVNKEGNSALNCASGQGHTDIVDVLLEVGVALDVPDTVTGKTSLIKAAYGGHDETIALLCVAGADTEAKDDQGYTALAFAAAFQHRRALRALLRFGANVNCVDAFGVTPLMHSASRGDFPAVALLLHAGARPETTDDEGRTAFEYSEVTECDTMFAADVMEELRPVSTSTAAAAVLGPPAGARLTPRMPMGGRKGKSSKGKQTNNSTGNAVHGASCGVENAVPAPISSKQVEQLDMSSMAFLSKKLVNLTNLLQKDTVAADVLYPSFCC